MITVNGKCADSGRNPAGAGGRNGKPRRVTIVDVASACSLVPSTVSNALAGKPHVKEQTRRLVIETAERLGYRASPVARGLRHGRSWAIGLLIADITNPYFGSLARGVEQGALRLGYHVIIMNGGYGADTQAQALTVLRDRGVDGVLLACQDSDAPYVKELARSGLPFALLNRRHRRVKADYVGVDNRRGIEAAVGHLIDLGHCRIGLVRGPADSIVTDERFEAFRDALAARATPVDPELIVDGELTIASGISAAQKLMTQARPPTAILATNDFMALGVLEGLMSAGYVVPRDVSVVGFDDIFVAALPLIRLTTVRQPLHEMGAAAVGLLVKRIEAKARRRPRELIFEPELVVRATSARPPQATVRARLNRRREVELATDGAF